MGIEVSHAGDDRGEWNRAVERSPQATPLHRYEAVRLLARESGTSFQLLMGHKGQEPVGLFPVFRRRRGPLTMLFSPPKDVGVHTLGPALLNHEKLKRRKAEKRNRRFVQQCLDRLEDDVDPDSVEVQTVPGYGDVRPFLWNGFDAEMDYTYVVDLTQGADSLFDQFSSEVRRKVRSEDAERLTVERGDAIDAGRIAKQVEERYDGRQEKYMGISPRLAEDLFEALPDDRIRAHVCRVDGEFVGGGITLETDDAAYRWQGFPKAEADFPVNDLLDWHIIQDAIDRDKTRYDLVGAMNARLSEYKSKFAPEIVPTYVVRAESERMRLASDVRELVGGFDALGK